jgi:hypothetical protein
MPPHCDSLVPVVTAARNALDATDVDLILPFVHADGAEAPREPRGGHRRRSDALP